MYDKEARLNVRTTTQTKMNLPKQILILLKLTNEGHAHRPCLFVDQYVCLSSYICSSKYASFLFTSSLKCVRFLLDLQFLF